MFKRLLILATICFLALLPVGTACADEPAADEPSVLDSTAEQSDSTAEQSDSTVEQSDSTAEQSDSTAEQGDSTAEQGDSDAEKSAAAETPAPRVRRIANYLSGARFTGQFTIDGKTDAKPESYTIASCEPLEDPDMYRLKVKIRYGDVDGEFPMDLKILWAGSTPVITLDAIWIPGLGTFSARVLIHQDRYAGTWQHDEKGGQLFGTIDKTKDE